MAKAYRPAVRQQLIRINLSYKDCEKEHPRRHGLAATLFAGGTRLFLILVNAHCRSDRLINAGKDKGSAYWRRASVS